MIRIEKLDGKRGVIVESGPYGIEVLTMRNGYQWSGMPADEVLLGMLQEAIEEFRVKAVAKVKGEIK